MAERTGTFGKHHEGRIWLKRQGKPDARHRRYPASGLGYCGGGTRFPDLAVRVDVTYLRQDFSLMQKVENGLTGAAEERFDFLVRTRELNDREVKAYQAWRETQGPRHLSRNHQAVLAALQRLTGLRVEPTAADWREALASY
jgi:hypothetical protein